MLSLKEWIRLTFGSQEKMDNAMGWGVRTTSRWMTQQPHRFFQYRRILEEEYHLPVVTLVRMIDQREREVLVGKKLRAGDTDDETLVVLSGGKDDAGQSA